MSEIKSKIYHLTSGLCSEQVELALTAMIERLESEQQKRRHKDRRELSEEVQYLQSQYHKLQQTTELFISKCNREL